MDNITNFFGHLTDYFKYIKYWEQNHITQINLKI